eukprot:5758066-Karenia_brevis.AAC.1
MSAAAIFKHGLSDHALLVTTFYLRKPVPKGSQPIAVWVAKSKVYKDMLRQALHDIDLSKYAPNEQVQLMQEQMRACAESARNILLQ